MCLRKLTTILPAAMLFCNIACTAALAGNNQDQPDVTPQVKELQQKMLTDEGIMALILTLQNDPEMQALLQDPAVVEAVNAGDISVLVNNPKFMKLMNNPKVREIQKKVNP